MFREIRECLKLDPDHKQCFPFYKKIRKMKKLLQDAETALEEKDYDTCIDSARRALVQESNEPKVQFMAYHCLCRCYRDNSEATQAINNCQEALSIRREPGVLCDSAEAYLAAEMFDDGNLVLHIFYSTEVCTEFSTIL